jgi:hypothetical protein
MRAGRTRRQSQRRQTRPRQIRWQIRPRRSDVAKAPSVRRCVRSVMPDVDQANYRWHAAARNRRLGMSLDIYSGERSPPGKSGAFTLRRSTLLALCASAGLAVARAMILPMVPCPRSRQPLRLLCEAGAHGRGGGRTLFFLVSASWLQWRSMINTKPTPHPRRPGTSPTSAPTSAARPLIAISEFQERSRFGRQCYNFEIKPPKRPYRNTHIRTTL